ncbi:Phosphoserine phosphatase 1 [subsurface metagenome]
MTRLLLVRHGETELNSAERYWGHSDVKLSALGIRQAEGLRDRLSAEQIDAIYSSDLKRALVTAKTIASGRQLAVITCAELREINFGKIEGLNFEEISQLFPEFAAKWRLQRDINLEFPGGESFNELNSRVSSFADRLRRHTDDEVVLVVAHAGVLRTLICQLMGIELRCIYQIRLDLASLSIVETYPQGAIVSLLNDTSHLRSK